MDNDLYSLLSAISTSPVYFGYLPSNKGATGVVFTTGDDERAPTFDAAPSFIRTDVEVDVWGKSPTTVATEASNIIAGLEGLNTTQGGTTFYNFVVTSTNSAFDAENDLFQKTISVIAHHN